MKQKTGRKLLSFLLSLALVLGLLPGMSMTAYADDVPYASLKNTTTVITFDGMEWYLINYDDETVTLLSKECVGASKYSDTSSYVEYDSSTVKTAVDNWYSNKITEGAQTAVNGGGMFLLTKEEENDLDPNVLKCTQASNADGNFWWLRSPGSYYTLAAGVSGADGEVSDVSVASALGVRPALQLDLSKVTFDSDTNTFSLGAAESTYTITVNSTTNGTVTAITPEGNTITRAAQGGTVLLKVSPSDGYELDTLTVTAANNAEVTVDMDSGTNDDECVFEMPASNVTVSATFKESASSTLDPVSYLDEDGKTQILNETYIGVKTDTTAWSAGWYVVNSDVTINGQVTLAGDVNLILCDNAELKVTNTSGDAIANAEDQTASLTIYAQSTGSNMGKLIATATGEWGDGISSSGAVTINGGDVTEYYNASEPPL